MFHLLILLTTLALLAYYWVRIKYSYWVDRNVPNIEPSFPFGNIREMGRTTHASKLIQTYYNELKGKGPFAGIFFFFSPVVVALDMEFIKNILIKDFSYFHDRGLYYNEVDDPLSAHLLSLEGSTWRNLRAKLTPTFTSGRLKTMLPTIVEVGDKLGTYLTEAASQSDEIEMKDVLARFTTDIIGSCAFGLECNSLEDLDAKFRMMGRKVLDEPRLSPLMGIFVLSFPGLAKRLHIKQTHDDVTEFFMKAVKDTIEFREKNNVVRLDFMDLLIKLKNDGYVDFVDASKSVEKLTVTEIAAQSFLFFLAGFETSSTAMSYTLYELSLNIEVQEKARKCVQDTLKKHNNEMTYEALMEMNYIEQCVLESLRKYPPISNIFRQTTHNYTVPGTNTVIEKGTSVLIPAYAIHYDPEFYPEPQKYMPERFSSEESKKRNPCTFLPFGEGPRVCIGQRFGLMQSRVGLAVLLNSFKFTPCSRSVIPLKFSVSKFILTPEDGLYLHVEKI